MKKVLQGLIAAAALVSAPAIAADMPVKSYSPPPPVYTWTGCYVGAGFGYKMWNREHDVYDPAGALNNRMARRAAEDGSRPGSSAATIRSAPLG